MNAEVVSVGTELLLGQTIDTHAATMAKILADCGISCLRRHTVGDNLGRIVIVLREALARTDVVIAIGGLGPTDDDLTRNAIAEALGDSMEHDPAFEEHLRRIIALRRLSWIDSFARQADRPASARFVSNANGSAPGLICEKGGKVVIALPGPRGEFVPMAEGPVREYLEGLHGGDVIHSRVLKICGMGESQVEDMIRPLLDGTNPTVAPYAHPGEVHLRVTARAPTREAADGLIDPVHAQIGSIVGEALFGADATTLEDAVVEMLKAANAKVAVAESMTGGAIGERLTNVAGSASAFEGGVIVYTPEAKQALLGVGSDVLKQFGPVSRESAFEMATRARDILKTDYAISVTGNAGPTSDVDGKPVGLVYIGIAGPAGCMVEEQRYRAGRSEIRRRTSQAALVALRRALLTAR